MGVLNAKRDVAKVQFENRNRPGDKFERRFDGHERTIGDIVGGHAG